MIEEQELAWLDLAPCPDKPHLAKLNRLGAHYTVEQNPKILSAKPKILAGLLFGGLTIGLVLAAPVRWAAMSTYRSMFPEQNPERPVYDDTAKAPVDLSTFVQRARTAWPKADAAMVHHAAIEVAVGLLHHSDIEVGSQVEGAFVPWRMPAWKAAEKIRNEISAASGFMTQEGRYVFRRK